MSRNMTKPTKWLCALRRLRLAWASAKVSSCRRRRHWSDWADLSLRWGHTHFVGFVMSRLKCWQYKGKHDADYNPLEYVTKLLTLTFQHHRLNQYSHHLTLQTNGYHGYKRGDRLPWKLLNSKIISVIISCEWMAANTVLDLLKLYFFLLQENTLNLNRKEIVPYNGMCFRRYFYDNLRYRKRPTHFTFGLLFFPADWF